MLGLIVTAIVAFTVSLELVDAGDPNVFVPVEGRLDPEALETFAFSRTYSTGDD